MVVTYDTGSGVTFVRHVYSVRDVDTELRAACALRSWHQRWRRIPGQVRLLANMAGLIDELLTARSVLLARDELAVIRACWWGPEAAWPQSEEVGSS